MNVFVFIGIGLNTLGTFCSVVWIQEIYKNIIILPILSADLESVCHNYHRHIVFPFLKHKTHKKPMQASDSPMFLYGAENLKMSEDSVHNYKHV